MKSIRAVVLSAGAWSMTSHLPALASDDRVELVAVSSPDPGRADALAQEFGAQNAETDWRLALEHNPDIVVVSSPPVAHGEQVTAALDRGAHVLVEKPFALDGRAAQAMQLKAEAAQRQLLVGFGWPQAPAFALSQKMVASGELGEIEHVMSHLAVNIRTLLSGGTDGGWAGAASSRPDTYTHKAVSGGGAGAVSMSHQLGLVSWITGLGFANASAIMFPQDSEIDLHVSANIELENGAGLALSCASTHPYLAEPQWHTAIYGSRGQLWVDSINGVVRLVRSGGEVVEFPSDAASASYDPTAPTRALIECALGAAAPTGMAASLGTRVVAATDAIYESARTRAVVQIEPIS